MNDNLPNNLSPLNGGPSLSPQSVVDNASIANCMNKNKQSLKVKLLLRRPIDVLVDQGILPPPKSSPAFYEQKLKLERAKTGDFLKYKIQRRPQRNELVQQHILEDTFDPSYYEQERKLKKARLADDLNQRLSHRPGPLELIKGNILHTDETFEQAIKEGQITFKKTCEGEIITNPPKRFVFEEESSSDSAPSPLQGVKSQTSLTNQQPTSTNYQFVNSTFVVSNNNLISSTQPADSPSIAISTSTPLNANLSYILTPSVSSACILPSNTSPIVKLNSKCLNVARSSSNNNSVISASSRSIDFKNLGPSKNFHSFSNCSQTINQKSKKKVKSKNQPKTRIIKFHEYTGPPNVKKLSNSSQSDAETSYELLLKQQQLFLQWQLECHQKFSDMTNQNNKCEKPEMPSVESTTKLIDNKLANNEFKIEDNSVPNSLLTNYQSKATKSNQQNEGVNSSSENTLNQPNDPQLCAKSINLKQFVPIVKTNISKFENMKVSDLKVELKKRNLPVSGAKQQLIERLKPFTDSTVSIKKELDGDNETVKLNQFSCQEIVNNNLEFKTTINQSGSTVGDPLSSNNSQTFILKNNITTNNINKNNVKLNEEFVLVTNGPDNSFPATIPLQLKQNNTINIETPTLTIPIANHGLNTFIPQYQIVTSTPTDNKINLNGLNIANQNTIQSQLAVNDLMLNNKLNIINSPQNIISTNLSYNQATGQMDKNSNLTFLTGAPIQLGSIKNNNLSFNITQPMPNIGNKLVSIQNSGPVFHQFLLYPTMIGTKPDISNVNTAPKQRSNSLPGETLHQLQRNSSFPFIINSKLGLPLAENSNLKNVNSNKVLAENAKPESMSGIEAQNSTMKIENAVSKTIPFNNVNTSTDVLFTNSIKTGVQKCNTENNKKLDNNLNKSNGLLFDIKEDAHKQNITDYVDSTNNNSNKNTGLLNSGNALVDNSSSLENQPDSTTNSNTLDLDFIINFDDLNDESHCNALIERPSEIGQQIQYKNEDQNDKSKNNCMIDFSDNWFEMTFGDGSTDHVQTNGIGEESNKQSDTGTDRNIDSNLLETINQLFDQNYSINDIKNNNYMNEDISKSTIFTKHDPVMSNNHTSSVPVSSSNDSQTGSSIASHACYNPNPTNNASLAAPAANSTCNNLKYNCFGNSSNLFNVDPFSEYFFEDADIKNSMDFSMC